MPRFMWVFALLYSYVFVCMFGIFKIHRCPNCFRIEKEFIYRKEKQAQENAAMVVGHIPHEHQGNTAYFFFLRSLLQKLRAENHDLGQRLLVLEKVLGHSYSLGNSRDTSTLALHDQSCVAYKLSVNITKKGGRWESFIQA